MNAEIIAVGSELLLGQIVNTNARFLSEQLAQIGINVFFHTVVGDNGDRLVQATKIAEKRADLLIFTGGLGPTQDDLTKEVLAAHLGQKLVYDQSALQYIEDFFKRSGRKMTANNRKQAQVLVDCTVFPNHYGMAPGLVTTTEKNYYILLPGPPSEMCPMFLEEVRPYLINTQQQLQIISRVLRFFGIGESALEVAVEDLLQQQTNPTIAPLASDGEVTLRLTVNHQNPLEAEKMLDDLEKKIQERVGEFFYGYDNETLMKQLVAKLKAQELTISAAESLTGGLFQQELTAISGVSSCFQGGIVSYANEAKINVLSVPADIIEQFGAVSEQCALAMAQQVKKKFQTDIGVSFTGVAGPDQLEGHPVGTVFLGFALSDGSSFVKQLQLGTIRSQIRIRSIKNSCFFLLQALK